MGVLLTAALIIAGTAVGVGAERRYPDSAVALAPHAYLDVHYL